MADSAHRHVVTSELEAAAARRAAGPERLGELIGEKVLGERSADVSSAWGAMRAWLSVNGRTERAHTTGVFVEPPRREGALPALVVYVDTKACEVDFRANAEVYLARLDAAGLRFSRVTFRQDRRGRASAAAVPREPGSTGAAPRRVSQVQPAHEALPELTVEEESEVAALVADLPEGLRASVSQAMRMSLRREKRSTS